VLRDASLPVEAGATFKVTNGARTPGEDDGDSSPASGAYFEPFTGAELPRFPSGALPAGLARYVEAVATHIQVPLDGPALMALATIAAACAKRIRVRRLADGYEQPLNLYLLGIGEPGERKSQIVSEVVKPLREYEAGVADDMHEQIVGAAGQRKFEEERAKYLRKGLATGKIKDKAKTLQDLRAELDALELEMAKPLVHAPRLVTTSPTPGKLEMLLAENGERLAILGAEGGVFGIVAGRFSGNSKAPPDLDVLLSAWSGDAGDSDRKTTTSARLKAPALTIGLFVQPQVLREVSDIYGADEKGLTSRFLIALVEASAHKQRYLGEPMDVERRAEWSTRVRELLEGFRADDGERIISLPTNILDPARTLFEEVTAEMAPGGPLAAPSLRAFGSKLRGQVERLIGVLHVARHGLRAVDEPCSVQTVEAAAQLARYFLAHGKAARGEMAVDPVTGRAQRLFQHCVYNHIDTFPRRDAQLNRWGGCRTPEQLDEALAELVRRGYFKKDFTKRKNPGAVGPVYQVTPAAKAHGAKP
jgi:replicative DNA helicase